MVQRCEFRFVGGRLALFDVKGSTVLQPSKQRVAGIGEMRTIQRKQVWTIALDEYEFVTAELRNFKPLPNFILQALRAPLTSVPLDTVRQRIGGKFYDMLYPYQRDGVARIMALGGRGMLADEMGLGKTFQAIGLIRAYPERRPVVIVCPASVRHNWIKNIREHVTENVQGLWKGKDVPSAEVVVLSYGLLATIKPKGEYYIYDESHKVKNYTANVTRAAVHIGKGKPHLLISGTPLTSPVHLFPQICLIKRMFHKFMGTKNFRPGKHPDMFADRYCRPRRQKKARIGSGQPDWDLRGADRLPELYEIMRRNYWVRRRKKDVKDDLPPKTRKRVYIHKCKGTPPKSNDPKVLHDAQHGFTKAVVETCLEKIQPFCDYIRTVILPRLDANPKLKVLIFAHHAPMLHAVDQELAHMKRIYVDGKVAPKKRGPLFDQFQEDPETRVAILSITACDTGITLTAAQLALVGEMRYGPDTMGQMEARFHRVGQTEPVTVEYMMADNSTDDCVWRMLNRKAGVMGTVLDNVCEKFASDGDASLIKEEEEDDEPSPKRRRKA